MSFSMAFWIMPLMSGLISFGKNLWALASITIVKSTPPRDEKVVGILSMGRIGAPETMQMLLEYLERKPDPVYCQALARALAETKIDSVREWVARDALQTARPDVLRAALEAMAAIRIESAAPRIAEVYERHESKPRGLDIACAAVRALGSMGDTKILLTAVRHEDWRIRMAAADVLLADLPPAKECESALKLLFVDAAPGVRRAAAQSAGRAKLESATPELIGMLLKDPRLRGRHAAYSALRAISGRDFSHDAAAWKQWWKDRKSDEEARTYTFARYYGMSVHSDRVVFIVDVSGSMNWPWRRDPKRIEVARRQLTRVVREMNKKTLFNLIVYSDKVRMWQKKEVEATAGNVAKALKWVGRTLVKPEGDTHTHAALKAAFAHNPEFDTIYLLSDGNPSDGDHVCAEGILAQVSVWNRHRRAAIHTIGLTLENLDRGMPIIAERPREMKAFMNDLARLTGGACKIVTNPPTD